MCFRTKEMFDIVIDYPDSTHALHDLKVSNYISMTYFWLRTLITAACYQECLQRVDQRTQFVRSLRKA